MGEQGRGRGFRIEAGVTNGDGGWFSGALDFFEDEFVHVGVDFDGVAFGEGAGEEFLGQVILQPLLDGSL